MMGSGSEEPLISLQGETTMKCGERHLKNDYLCVQRVERCSSPAHNVCRDSGICLISTGIRIAFAVRIITSCHICLRTLKTAFDGSMLEALIFKQDLRVKPASQRTIHRNLSNFFSGLVSRLERANKTEITHIILSLNVCHKRENWVHKFAGRTDEM